MNAERERADNWWFHDAAPQNAEAGGLEMIRSSSIQSAPTCRDRIRSFYPAKRGLSDSYNLT